MQHKVLARKMRPQDFSSLVGQDHIKKALSNAIANNRLHHAYLFTGTRGVGKTSLARILVKCLNCETGITNTPCNKCNTCIEITNGSYPDLLEIDAASRTKVEDTREILEQVQYAPIKGRFKIFLIDEVHMLSGHSFNALLKTLEEPPEHVKFLLATTDPQKLPITVLSRCLQFNLQPIPKPKIVEHLGKILTEEHINYEPAALDLLATSAEGSLRDALSITDQAISFCDNNITADAVASILGISPRKYLEDLLRGTIENNPQLIFSTLNSLEIEGADFSEVLKELATLFHSLAYAQILPQALQDKSLDANILKELAQKASPEEIQLYYQFCLEGRRDLPLAPDYKCGIEMTFMRMLAFKPIGKNLVKSLPQTHIENSLSREEKKNQSLTTPPSENASTESATLENSGAKPSSASNIPVNAKPIFDYADVQPESTATNLTETISTIEDYSDTDASYTENSDDIDDIEEIIDEIQTPIENLKLENNSDWINIYTNYLQLDQMLKILLGETCFIGRESNTFKFEILSLNKELLQNKKIENFSQALHKLLKMPVNLEFVEVEAPSLETPSQYIIRLHRQQREKQIEEIMKRETVGDIIRLFNAKLEN